MSIELILVQVLNGLQYGVLLFLIAAGLTLVFGVMGFINLAHGVQYMVGAYFAVAFYGFTGHFFLTVLLALGSSLLLGLVLEFLIFRHLYHRNHLDQVVATFGVILLLDQASIVLWGGAPLNVPEPEIFSVSIRLVEGLLYPVYRLAILGAGLLVALLLWIVITKTRVGMLVRAGASDPDMVSALGVNVRLLFMLVFGFGAMLAGLAGVLAAPIFSVEPGMGNGFLIVAFVVIVIGGIGSIRGGFIAALVVGLVDTLGRSFLTDLLKLFMDAPAANQVGPAIASMLIYVLMACILFFKPSGLFAMRRAG